MYEALWNDEGNGVRGFLKRPLKWSIVAPAVVYIDRYSSTQEAKILKVMKE